MKKIANINVGTPVIKYHYVPRYVRFTLITLASLGLITAGFALGIIVPLLKADPGLIPSVTKIDVPVKEVTYAASFEEAMDDESPNEYVINMDAFGTVGKTDDELHTEAPQTLLVASVKWEPENFEKEVECLAQNIYFEAHTESIKGQIAVGLVTLNRVLSETYPNTICEVVWQKALNRKTGKMVAQFSWTWDGKKDVPTNDTAYEEAIMLAEAFLAERSLYNIADFTKGATHYHATYVKPWWRKHFTKVATVDTHIFYRDERRTPKFQTVNDNPVALMNDDSV